MIPHHHLPPSPSSNISLLSTNRLCFNVNDYMAMSSMSYLVFCSIMLCSVCSVLYYCFLLLVLSCVNTSIMYFSLFSLLPLVLLHLLCMLNKQLIWL